ncbi:hypothetical protein D3C83_285940 [compost metagenome]
MVAVAESLAQALGEQLPDRSLAGAHQTDQEYIAGNGPPAGRRIHVLAVVHGAILTEPASIA